MAGLERVVFVCVWDAAWDTVCAVCYVRIIERVSVEFSSVQFFR